MAGLNNVGDEYRHHFVSRHAIHNSTPVHRPHTKEDIHCGHGDLLGPLGLFVQGLLAIIAFTSLIGKTYDQYISLKYN